MEKAAKLMDFTDDDIREAQREIALGNADFLDVYEFKALIARLKAAEEALVLSYESLDSGAQYDHIDTVYNAWRKAAGKSSEGAEKI